MNVEMLVQVIILGIGATVLMDLWALLRLRLFHVPSLDYALIGRWIGHMSRGVFRHEGIGRTQPIKGEGLLGWVFHYLTGVVFAGVFLMSGGKQWLVTPTLLPALLFGGLSVLVPWLLMQPAFGMGIAASRLLNPWQSRFMSFLTHLVFGLGLYLTAVLLVAV